MSSPKLLPGQIRLHRAPLLDPPFDDELLPTTYRPVPYEPRLSVPSAAVAGASPECHTAALRFLNVSLELFNGFRSPAQMRPLIALEQGLAILDELARAARSAYEPPTARTGHQGAPQPGPHLRAARRRGRGRGSPQRRPPQLGHGLPPRTPPHRLALLPPSKSSSSPRPDAPRPRAGRPPHRTPRRQDPRNFRENAAIPKQETAKTLKTRGSSGGGGSREARRGGSARGKWVAAGRKPARQLRAKAGWVRRRRTAARRKRGGSAAGARAAGRRPGAAAGRKPGGGSRGGGEHGPSLPRGSLRSGTTTGRRKECR